MGVEVEVNRTQGAPSESPVWKGQSWTGPGEACWGEAVSTGEAEQRKVGKAEQ